MDFMRKLERRFGRYAIRNLPMIVILLEVIGYTLQMVAPQMLSYICFSAPEIAHGQVWRLVTWVMMPPSSLDIFTVIMLFFYYSIAQTLANTWGDFYFNVYIFGGIIITDIGMMITYAVLSATGSNAAMINIAYMSVLVTMFYIQTTILLAFAFTYPNMQVLLFFVIPIKMSWLGIFEGIMLAYDFIRVDLVSQRVQILMAVVNFLLYFMLTKNMKSFTPKGFARRPHGSSRSRKKTEGGFSAFSRSPGRTDSSAAQSRASDSGERKNRSDAVFPRIHPGGARHRCTVCGRTELDDERLEFRFCSKCEGSHEYCQDHLFTHQHIKNGVPGGISGNE